MSRAAVALLLMLGACAVPSGDERRGCNASWLDAPSVAATGSGVQTERLKISCVEGIANRRLRLGFTLPPGPDCHVLQRVELLESADAISITLIGAVNDDLNAGVCPNEPRMVVTEVDLASPVGDRALLDGGVGTVEP
ncbi:MAG: hypothetical protein ACR2GO_02795 [Candidatus Limnocylindria bacterium]